MYNSGNIAVLIPAYNPGNTLPDLVKEIHNNGFSIIVVNDGSDESFAEVFEKTSEYAAIIEHENNRGKGAALKTGIKYIKEKCAHLAGFITADADGQHSVKDIIRVAHKMNETDGIVLGMRNLRDNIPFKSKFGNVLSKWVFGIVTGKVLEDNQAGLRGFSTKLCDWLLSIEGKFYEYEMYMLVKAVRDRIEIVKLPIDTIYIDNNSTTHFKPVKDTCRIQGSLIKNGMLSIIMYIIVMALTSAAVMAGLEWYYYVIGGCLVFLTHTLIRIRERNLISITSILIKYIFTVLAISWLYHGTNTVVSGIIASIVFIPVISYIFAFVSTEKLVVQECLAGQD